jgi:hypothetical protein
MLPDQIDNAPALVAGCCRYCADCLEPVPTYGTTPRLLDLGLIHLWQINCSSSYEKRGNETRSLTTQFI